MNTTIGAEKRAHSAALNIAREALGGYKPGTYLLAHAIEKATRQAIEDFDPPQDEE